MATLQNAQIDQTYQALLKAGDNGAITATPKAITDGAGNATNILMSNTATNFASGTVDFTGATVSGLPAATAGLELGTGTNALQNAIGSASNASGAQAIALGAGALASGSGAMAYGDQAQATQTHSAAFGQYAEATNSYAIAFGRTSAASGDGSVAFGQQTSAAQAGAVAMGRQVQSDTADTTHVRALKIVAPDGGTGGNGITMLSPDGTAGVVTLTNASELAIDGTPIGGGGGAAGLESGTGTDSMQSAASLSTNPANAAGTASIAIGDGADATRNQSISIGDGATINTSGASSVAIGTSARVDNDESVSIGKNASSHYQGIALGINSKAGTTSNKGNNIAIGSGAVADTIDANVAIGQNAQANKPGSVALGNNVVTGYDNTVSIKALETQTDSTPTAGGIIMSDAGGTDRRINIDASGNLQVDSTPVGASAQRAAKATLAGPTTQDTLVSTITIPANTYAAGDIIKVWYMMSGDYTGGGSIYFNSLLSNGSTLTNGSFQYGLGSNGSSSNNYIGDKHLIIHTSDGTGDGTSSGSVDGMLDFDVTSGAFSYPDNIAKAVDWTTTQYIHLYGYVDNAGSSLTVQGGYVKKEA